MPSLHEDMTHCRERLRQIGRELERSFRGPSRTREGLGRRHGAVDAEHGPGVRLPDGGQREGGVLLLGGLVVSRARRKSAGVLRSQW